MYLRALLFVGTGIGALVGALLVLSRLLVADAEERLLEERVNLARTLGRVLEQDIRSEVLELERLAERIVLEPDRAREKLLEHASTQTLFGGGVFILDKQRQVVATLGSRHAAELDPGEFGLLIDTARARGRLVVDQPRRVGDEQVIVLAVPIIDPAGKVLGTLVVCLDSEMRRTLTGFGLLRAARLR